MHTLGAEPWVISHGKKRILRCVLRRAGRSRGVKRLGSMPYQFHIFLTHRRHREWPEWVKDKFLPIFQPWLGEELGEDNRTFFDQEIETGTAWPHKLAQVMAEFRVLVPLWSRQ